jgi:pyruvate-formate lyase-activating enzyme
MPKKVTFVYRNYEGLGVGYLAAYARAFGHRVQLVLYPDPWSDTYVKQKDKDTPMTGRLQRRVDRELLREIVEFGPDLVCFSTVTDDYRWCSRTAGIIKAATGALTLFGGVHVASVPERVVLNPNVDLLGLGEGERLLVRLLEALDDWRHGGDLDIPGIWYRRGEEVRGNGEGESIQDLDSLPFPAKDLFYARLPGLARTYTIITSRGCPYQCTYCYNAVMLPKYRPQGKWLRQRSVDNVIEECRDAVHRFRPRHFLFMDDVFASSRKWVEQFAERYRREVGVPFALVTEAVVLKDDVVRCLKEAGLVNVQMGVQTLNEQSKERISRPESREQLERAMNALNRHKVHFQVDHMLGLPGETDEDQRVALEFYNEHRPDIVSVFWLKYYPKLPIIDFAIEKGILGPEDIEDIEEGRNEASYLFGGNAPDFRAWLGYNMLFGWLNFVPRWVVAFLLRQPRRVARMGLESFFLSSSLPRILSTIFRRPDFRGRDHLRRSRGQLIYIARLSWRDARRRLRRGVARTTSDLALSRAVEVPEALPAGTGARPETTRVLVGRRSGGGVYAAARGKPQG